jgi:pantothenate kinase
MARPVTFAEFAAVVAARGAARRSLTAIAGAPGSGKSYTAERLVAHLNGIEAGSAAVLPMDGYHFDDMILVPRGLRPRKGAPDTFDVGGLRHMLLRLKENAEAEIMVPVFDRDIEIARAAARAIAQTVPHIVVEGNYLLLDREPWPSLSPAFDTTAMLDVPEEVLRERLRARWVGYGLSEDEIRAKLEDNDLPNGRLVATASRPAEFVLKSGDAGARP